MSSVTWADIRPGDVVRLKGKLWTVTQADPLDAGRVMVSIRDEGTARWTNDRPGDLAVERVETIGETVREEAGELPAAEAVAQVQLGAVVIGRKDGTAPWQVVGVDETMIHAHLYTFHGIDVVAVGSAAEAMALHLADHAAAVKAGAFVEHEHVS